MSDRVSDEVLEILRTIATPTLANALDVYLAQQEPDTLLLNDGQARFTDAGHQLPGVASWTRARVPWIVMDSAAPGYSAVVAINVPTAPLSISKTAPAQSSASRLCRGVFLITA